MVAFKDALERTLHIALEHAAKRRHEYATLEHLLMSMIVDPDASIVLAKCGVNLGKLAEVVRRYLDNELQEMQMSVATEPVPTSGFQRAIQRAILHVQSSGRDTVTGANVLVALFSERDSYAVYFLQQQDMSRLDAVSFLSHGVGKIDSVRGVDDFEEARRRINAELALGTGELHLTNLKIDQLPRELSRIPHLESIELSYTNLHSLIGIESLKELKSINIFSTNIRDLTPLKRLRKLNNIDAGKCKISENIGWISAHKNLTYLSLYQSSISGIPEELFGSAHRSNCLSMLRDYFQSTKTGVVPLRNVKLFILGNGSVGKTQLGRMMKGRPYDDTVVTTHGIDIDRLTLLLSGTGQTTVNLWDFGGQPLYHGTHVLFLCSRAIYILAWSPEHEGGSHVDIYGVEHANQPLEYWVDYVRAAAGENSAALIVQTRCDRGVQRTTKLPVSDGRLAQFGDRLGPPLAVSAKDGLGRDSLMLALTEAVDQVLRSGGNIEISAPWEKVINAIELMRPDDGLLPMAERTDLSKLKAGKRRFISYDEFTQLSKKNGVSVGIETLLYYMHSCGQVYHEPNRFDGIIIIDQNWMLEAIYTLFERKECRRQLLERKGRFTKEDIALWLWNAQGHSVETQDLFISFMISCGLCFKHYDQGRIDHYIAPGALPDLSCLPLTVQRAWRDDWPKIVGILELGLLHDGITGYLISKVGTKLGPEADYWFGGVQLYDPEDNCVARIHAERGPGIAGRIFVDVRHPPNTDESRAQEILADLRGAIDQYIDEYNVNAIGWTINIGPDELRVNEGPESRQSILSSNGNSRRLLIIDIIEGLNSISTNSELYRLMVLLDIPLIERPVDGTLQQRGQVVFEWAERNDKLKEFYQEIVTMKNMR